jgi:hypothetical protein
MTCGEIARAVLTERNRTRRYRCYTQTITLAAVNIPVSQQFQILDKELFLWTDFSVFQSNPTDPFSTEYCFEYDIRQGNNKRAISRIPLNARSYSCPAMAVFSSNPTQQYSMFYPEDLIYIEASTRYAEAINKPITFVFGGVSYWE